MLNLGVHNLVGSFNTMVFGSNKFRIRRSQSKASYLAYRRERGAPDSEGSYKRTMSPTARLDDWPPPRERDDPVLLRVTPNNQHISDRLKSHSVDALHQRIEERSNAHTVEVIGKLSQELTKKLQATESRTKSESNNNCSVINNNDHRDKPLEHRERLSPQSVQVLNDRNRQLERERRKLAASCEPVNQPRLLGETSMGIEDFYRERSATIEMTSRNVELLNRRNRNSEKRHSATPALTDIEKSLSGSGQELQNREQLISKPPPPLTSPPRSPELEHEDKNYRGAVPRRSGSSSSSSSTSTRSSVDQTVILSRASPPKVNFSDSLMKNEFRKSPREQEKLKDVKEGISSTPRSKVSSPAQTENSWTKFGISQSESLFRNKVRRTSSLGSRSSTLSSASKTSSTSSSSISPRYSPVEKKSSPCVSPQPGFECLTLVQRSEIVLRVNGTIDASSQTEILDDDTSFQNNEDKRLIPEPRKKLPEEIECDELTRDLVNQLGPNDKLVPILVPAPEHKKPTDYVSGLFRVEATLQPRLRRPASTSSLPDNETEDDRKNDTMPTTPVITSGTESSSPLSPTSTYFTTSESKAKFLTRYSQDVADVDISNGNDEASTEPNIDNLDLRQKKEELVLRLDRKVVVLRAEQEAVREEGEMNEALGAKVATRISAVARPVEASKFRLHVEEVGKITSLLLGLSGRLARAENALHGMPADHPERKILESKRDKLLDQLEEAKILKSNIDRRSVNVSSILSKYLNDDEFADYQHFLNMKTKLIMDGREIQDKVKLGEEQLTALKEAIG